MYTGSQRAYDVIVEENVPVCARDGTRLATDLYRPALGTAPADGRFPAILYRTPYDRQCLQLHHTGHFFAARGYAFVAQDCRGRYGSEGSFAYLYDQQHEGLDGHDTIEWIAGQPWSDGKVGTTGVSYEGAIQQAAAIVGSSHLAAQVIIDTGYKYHTKTVRNSGAFSEGTFVAMAFWLASTGKEAQADPAVKRALRDALARLPEWFERLPLKHGASPLALAPSYEQWFFDIATGGDYDAPWQNPTSSFEDHVDAYPDIPVLLLTSWYSHHAWANFKKRRALLNHRRTQPVKLVCGTWIHGYGTMQDPCVGEVDFGSAASLGLVDDFLLRWFDEWLKGHDTGASGWAPIRLFVMGGGTGRLLDVGLGRPTGRLSHGGSWHDEEEWPPARACQSVLYLGGAGTLSAEPPAADGSATAYAYDPDDPAPTVGGSIQNAQIGVSGILYGGGFDQRGRENLVVPKDTLPLSARADVLVFRTGVLTEPLEVTGPVEVRLYVASSARDTDFVAKLIDEYPPSEDYPHGFALNLCGAVVRMRYRNGRRKAGLIEPGTVYEVTVGPLLTSNLFLAGYRIRLDVSSSSSPQLDVNPNTGGPLGLSSGSVVARNTVYHCREHPSCVCLPTVPTDALATEAPSSRETGEEEE